MAFPTKQGDKKNSKFRSNHADKMRGMGEKEPGPRAQAHAMGSDADKRTVEHAEQPEEKEQEPTYGESESPMEEQAEEQVHPGLHDEVKQIVAQHGPAHTVHVSHDHEAGMHHTVSHHPTGHVHEKTHTSAMHAHHHAMHAAGLTPPAPESENEHPMGHEGGEDDFEPNVE